MIYKYKRQYPSSSLLVKEVNTEEGIKMVLDGVLDMSVVIEPFEDQRIEKEPVVQSEAVLLVSNDHPFERVSLRLKLFESRFLWLEKNINTMIL